MFVVYKSTNRCIQYLQQVVHSQQNSPWHRRCWRITHARNNLSMARRVMMNNSMVSMIVLLRNTISSTASFEWYYNKQHKNCRHRALSVAQRDLLSSINQFQRRRHDATIDVWWLYDDGGLALLVPLQLCQSWSYLEVSSRRDCFFVIYIGA